MSATRQRAAESRRLIGETVSTLRDYEALGGIQALRIAAERGPGHVIPELLKSGLRGRGGAGFPTGRKWQSVLEDPHPRKYVVCNAAEGEPGTFKDRWLLEHNPYQVIEGLAIAGLMIGAERAFIALKHYFTPQIEALERALREMSELDMLPLPVEVVPGPDEYLFGEETGLLEVIEGNMPLPRGELRPYQAGLFHTMQSPNPTLVNNVETLAHVPQIVCNGADWFRSLGTERSPGTMLFTLSGDVETPGVYELPLGVPLRTLVEEVGGGVPGGRRLKAVFTGASVGILTPDQIDTPLDFESLQAAGSGLGSGGFIVYDDTTCMVNAALTYSRFLYVESCGQCPPCKLGSEAITADLARIQGGEGTERDLDDALQRCLSVTDARRCALPVGESLLVQSLINAFRDEFVAHLGTECPLPRDVPLPKFLDYDQHQARFTYDERYRLKQPDWTYAKPGS